MAGPWEKYQSEGQAKGGPWGKYAASPAASEEGMSKSGMILPISRDAEGNVSFDSDAGILGSLKRTFMLPGQVMKGEVDPMSQAGIGRALEFATVVSPVNPAIRVGDRAIPGVLKSRRKVAPPSTEALYSEAKRNFDAMRDSGVEYSVDAVKDVARALKTKLEAEGFDAEVAGKTHRILDKLANPPEGAIADIKGLHSARKTFGKIAQNFNDKTDQSAASRVIRGLDDFIGADDAASVVAGTASDASSALKAGNANYAAAKRSDLINGIDRAAGLRADAADSGANLGNSIRQRVASALLQPKKVSGFNPEEVAALEAVTKGTRTQNLTRWAGNVLGGGGGLGQMLTAAIGGGGGAAVGGPVGGALGAAVPVLAGKGFKSLSNRLTKGALSATDDLIRSRSPLYEKMLSEVAGAPLPADKKAAVIRAIVAGGGSSQMSENDRRRAGIVEALMRR